VIKECYIAEPKNVKKDIYGNPIPFEIKGLPYKMYWVGYFESVEDAKDFLSDHGLNPEDFNIEFAGVRDD
jgi:hypothetical protein